MKLNRRSLLSAFAGWTLLLPASAFADGGGKEGRGDDDDDDRESRGRGKSKRGRRRRYRDSDGDVSNHDHERAAAARKSGTVRPLSEIVTKLRKSYKGEIVGVEFELEDGIWVYEIKIVTRGGRYLKIYVDARTTEILKVRGR